MGEEDRVQVVVRLQEAVSGQVLREGCRRPGVGGVGGGAVRAGVGQFGPRFGLVWRARLEKAGGALVFCRWTRQRRKRPICQWEGEGSSGCGKVEGDDESGGVIGESGSRRRGGKFEGCGWEGNASGGSSPCVSSDRELLRRFTERTDEKTTLECGKGKRATLGWRKKDAGSETGACVGHEAGGRF